MIEIRGPDGSINRFPDGTPDDVIERAMRQQFGGPEPEAASADAAVEDPNTRALKYGTQKVGKGLADIAGLPVDIMTAAMNFGAGGLNLAGEGVEAVSGVEVPDVGYIEKPFLGSDHISESVSSLAEMLGYDPVEDEEMHPSMQLLGTAERFATAGGGSAGLLSKASKGGQIAELAPELVHPYIKAPGRTAVGDTGAGAGSGVAIDMAHDWLPEWMQGPITTLLAAFGGGSAGHYATNVPGKVAAMPGAIADRFVPADKVLFDSKTGTRPSVRAADDAARFVQETATDKGKAAQEMREADQFFTEAGGAKPTSATMTTDPGLQLLERGMRDRNGQPFIENDAALKESARSDLDMIRPEGADTTLPRQLSEQNIAEVNAWLDDIVRQATANSDAAVASEQAIGQAYRPYAGGRDAASESLDRVIVDETMRPMQTQKNENFRNIDPGGEVMLPTENLVALMNQLEEAAQGLPASMRRDVLPEPLIHDIQATQPVIDPQTGENVGGAGEMSFRDMNEMRPILSARESAARQNAQFPLADTYRDVRGAINNESRALEARGDPAGQRAAEAGRYYREDFAPFTHGEGAKLRKDINADDLQRSKTPPTATGQRFLKPGAGGSEAARDMQEILSRAPNPAAGQAAARDYVLDSLAQTVIGPDGAVVPRSLETWIAQREGMLSQIPELRTEVDGLLAEARAAQRTTATRADDLRTAQRFAADQEKDLNKSALAQIAGKDPDHVASGILGSKDPVAAIRELRAQRGWNRQTDDGLKATISDHLIGKLTDANDLPTHAKISSTFKKYESVLKEAYGDDIKFLRQAQRRMEALSRRAPQAVPGSATAERSGLSSMALAAMKPAEVILRLRFGMLKGGGITSIANRMAKQLPDSSDATQQLILRFAFEPEVAKHLLERPVAEIGTVTWNKKLNTLIGWAAAGRESSAGER